MTKEDSRVVKTKTKSKNNFNYENKGITKVEYEVTKTTV